MKKYMLFFILLVFLFVTKAMAGERSYADKSFQISLMGNAWTDIGYPIVRPGTATVCSWGVGPSVSVSYLPVREFALGVLFDPSPLDVEVATTEGSVLIAHVNYQAAFIANVYPQIGQAGALPHFGLNLVYTDVSGTYLQNGKNRFGVEGSVGIDFPINDMFAVSAEYQIPWNTVTDTPTETETPTP